MTVQKKILVVSEDLHLADVRKDILEEAGFEVLSAHNFKEVQDACKKKPDLVMIGYSLRPAEKRRVWYEVREHCTKRFKRADIALDLRVRQTVNLRKN
jgi:DNA-binding response OmpR family regulator